MEKVARWPGPVTGPALETVSCIERVGPPLAVPPITPLLCVPRRGGWVGRATGEDRYEGAGEAARVNRPRRSGSVTMPLALKLLGTAGVASLVAGGGN